MAIKRGSGGLSESVKRVKFVTNLFSNDVERSSKKLWVPSKLDIVKRMCIFHLILVGIPSSLILSSENKGGEGGGESLLKEIVKRAEPCSYMGYSSRFKDTLT